MENNDNKVINRRDFLKLGILTTTAVAASSCSINAEEEKPSTESSNVDSPLKAYTAKDFSHLKGQLKGISDSQLDQHLTLYKKYIAKINTVEEKINAFNATSGDTAEYRPLQTAQTYMLNGAVLHELYFGNLGATDKDPVGKLKNMIERDFGNIETFLGHLTTAGKVMKGWAIAAYNFRTGKINVYGMDQHNDLVPSMVYPILALDVYEHAYMVDYGIDRGKYLNAFVANLNWRPVAARLELAMSIPFGDRTTA